MIDTRFYDEPTPVSVDTIVKLINGEKYRGSGSLMVRSVAPADKVDVGGLCFVQSKSLAENVKNEKGVVCLATPDIAKDFGNNICVILTTNPKRDFGIVIEHMFKTEAPSAVIDPTSSVAPDAVLGEGCRVDAFAVIDAGVELGAGCHIKSGAYIGKGCVLGKGCIVEANASLTYTIMGDHGQIGPSSVIGFTGFGVSDNNGQGIIPHLGRVIIGDHFHIGANSCIDRGFIDDSIVGKHVMIDNMVQIGHNCNIGDNTIICGNVGISGSTTIGKNNIFGGQAGVGDHITIGSDNIFTARCGVTKSVGDGQIMAGFPAVPARDYRREVAALRRLAQGRKTSKT